MALHAGAETRCRDRQPCTRGWCWWSAPRDELAGRRPRVTSTSPSSSCTPGQPDECLRWAHVQTDAAGHRIGRVAGRPLCTGHRLPGRAGPRLPTPTAPGRGTAPADVTVAAVRLVAVPDGGSGRQFRGSSPPALHAGDAPSGDRAGAAGLPRVPAAPDLEVRGALAPIDSADAAPCRRDRARDLAGLRTPRDHEVGRPDRRPAPLRRRLARRRTGRHDLGRGRSTATRGIAASPDSGLELGIQLQDELVEDALTQLGALAEARQKVSYLVLGWRPPGRCGTGGCRPTAGEQLWMLGPALGRMATRPGTVRELSTATDRALPAGVWSTAARRVLRAARAGRRPPQPGTIAAAPVLAAANAVPPPPPPSFDGVTGPARTSTPAGRDAATGTPSPAATRALAEQATAARRPDPGTRPKEAVDRIVRAAGRPRAAPDGAGELRRSAGADRRQARWRRHARNSEPICPRRLINLGGRFDQPAPSSAEQLETIA